jgi:hypothetical protein
MYLRFQFEKVLADRRFRWIATTGCLRCGRRVTVVRGEVNAVLRAANEVIGVTCTACLDAVSRKELAHLRGQRAVEQP